MVTLLATLVGMQVVAADPRAKARDIELSSEQTVNTDFGQVRIESKPDGERVTVLDKKGREVSSCWCESENGTWLELSSFFRSLKKAVTTGKPEAVAALVRYPLRVNAKEPLSIANRSELLAKYAQVFTPETVAALSAADPRALFCRTEGAMIADGVAWASAKKGKVALDVVNVR